MFKVLLPVVLAITVVLSDGKDNIYAKDLISGVIVNPLPNGAYSFYEKSIRCVDVDQWEKDYKILEEKGAPLPKVLKYPETTAGKELCGIILKDLFILDLKIYWNIPALIESLRKLVNAIHKANINKCYSLTLESFAYEPLTRRYVFIDLEKKQTDKVQNAEKDCKTAMSGQLLSLLEAAKISLDPSDIKDINSISLSPKNYPNELIYPVELGKMTFVNNKDFFPKIQGHSSSLLIIDIKNQGNYFDLSVLHGGKQIVFNSIRKADTFMVYVCKKINDSSDVECSNIYEEEIKLDYIKQYQLSTELRVDIEVRESLAQTNDWIKERSRAFFEIFIMIKPKEAPGITRSLNYNSLGSSLQIRNTDLIICETVDGKMNIMYYQNNILINKDLPIKFKDADFMNPDETIQISPYYLLDKFILGKKQIKRVFLVFEAIRRTIFTVEGPEQSITMVSIQKLKLQTYPLFLKKCDDFSAGLSFSTDPNIKELKYKFVTKKYPSPIFFIDFYSNKVAKDLCFRENSGEGSILDVDIKIPDHSSFYWNFNVDKTDDGKLSNRSVLNFIVNPRDSFNNFEFKEFAWPMAEPYIIYVSISYDGNRNIYYIQVFFFKEDGRLYNIFNHENDPITVSPTLPKGFIYNKENSSFSTTLNNKFFTEYDAVYLSSYEIIYQIKNEGFKNCDSTLKFETTDFLRVWCKGIHRDLKSPDSVFQNIRTEGIQQIFYQAKPVISKQQEDKVARILL